MMKGKRRKMKSWMKSTWVFKPIVYLALVLLLLVLAGCARRLVVYPITKEDIWISEDGKKICMSKWYFENVLKARVKN